MGRGRTRVLQRKVIRRARSMYILPRGDEIVFTGSHMSCRKAFSTQSVIGTHSS